MDLKDIGETLRQERLRQGLAVEDIARRTKISRRAIEALEDGRMADLPHPVYVKGFIQAYSRMVNLEIKEAGQIVDAAYFLVEGHGGRDKKAHAFQNISAHPSVRGRGRRLEKKLITLVVLLALVGAAIAFWFAFDFFSSKTGQVRGKDVKTNSQVAPTPAERPQTLPAKPATPPPAPAPAPVVAAPPAQSAPVAANATGPSPEPRPKTLQDLLSQQNKTESAPPQAQPEAKPANYTVESTKPNATQIVELSAVAACWVGSVADNATRKDFELAAGQRALFKFAQTLYLRLGNPSGVKARYNGKDYSLKVGGVESYTMVFPPSK